MTSAPDTFLLKSRNLVTATGIHEGALWIEQGKIRAVLTTEPLPASLAVEDVGNLFVLPGLVDTHVHINEPGRTEWEGFETATRAAAAGGITTLVDMPLNSSPVTTTVQALQRKRDAAHGRCYVDVGFQGGLIPGNIDDIEPLLDAGVLGIKAFLVHSGIDDFPNATETELRAAMPILARRKVPLLVHAELEGPQPSHSADPQRYADYAASRPPEWEERAIRWMLELCAEYHCAVHIVHLATATALPLLRAARESGMRVTVETCPHYLIFRGEDIADGDTRYKCAPPIRNEENRRGLWSGLAAGDIDLIASDHSPCPPELKRLESGNFKKAWGGISSLQIGLSAVWSEARKRGFSLHHVAEWMCTKPAGLAGLHRTKGVLAPGMDADFVVFDPDASFTVVPDLLHHRHKLTPYEGKVLQGVVRCTYLRGRRVYRADEAFGTPSGRLLRREE